MPMDFKKLRIKCVLLCSPSASSIDEGWSRMFLGQSRTTENVIVSGTDRVTIYKYNHK